MKRLLIVPVVALAVALLVPIAAEADDTPLHPHEVVPVDEHGVDDSDRICHGQFVLHATCEVHGEDLQHGWLNLQAYADPIPTGNGTEVSAWVRMTAYDLDNNNEVVLVCEETRTFPEPNPILNVSGRVLNGWSTCTTGTSVPDKDEANLLIEIESNSAGDVWASVY